MAMLNSNIRIPKSVDERLEELKSSGISCLGLPQRTINGLESQGIETVGDLLNCCDQPPEACMKHCKCLEAFAHDPGLQRKWLPKCYLREIPGFAEITIERILAVVKEAINKIRDGS
jgi:hypothetical protein